MEIIALIILSIAVVLLGFTTANMLLKVEAYEDFIDSELKNNETLLETLRKIDNKQMFEKDDEVGSLFELVKQTIIRFKQFKNAKEKTT
jgi:hypothetical protein